MRVPSDSKAKATANRRNARASTGPKSARGRMRSARNALRHGLSLSACSDPVLSEDVEALAREIVDMDARAELLHLARRVAEAQIDLRRVRHARHQFLSQALTDPYCDDKAKAREKMAVISRLGRPNVPEVSLVALSKYLTKVPEGLNKLVLIVAQEAEQLSAMDRYERRALSRRKFAVRAFDLASFCRERQNIT